MKTFIFLAFLLSVTYTFGQHQDVFEPFKASDYPKADYQITSDAIQFKDLNIEVQQVRNKSGKGSFSCRAWLIVSKNNKSVYQRYFKSIDAIGDCYGLFIPIRQPREDFFIVSKLGDYDGRIFIIDSKGKVTEKIGGAFYISKDTRYLFSHYHSDSPGLTVYDFEKEQTLFSDTITPRLFDWFYKDGKYICGVDLLNNQISANGQYYFDLVSRKLVPIKLNSDYLKPEDMLNSYNDRNSRRFCNCGLEIDGSQLK
jgi:hypothetical protein